MCNDKIIETFRHNFGLVTQGQISSANQQHFHYEKSVSSWKRINENLNYLLRLTPARGLSLQRPPSHHEDSLSQEEHRHLHLQAELPPRRHGRHGIWDAVLSTWHTGKQKIALIVNDKFAFLKVYISGVTRLLYLSVGLFAVMCLFDPVNCEVLSNSGLF